MAKPKGTGTSSYERINQALAGTSEFKEYEEAFKRLVKSVRVDGVSYEKLGMSSSLDGMPDHHFEVAVGERRVPELRFKDLDQVRVSVEHIVTADSLKPVLECFGKKVPTFFCKEEQVAGRFLTFARERLGEKCPGILEEARMRLVSQAQSMISSGHVQEGRMVAYENEAVDEIRTVLLKFRNIRKEALKRAIDEFIVHDVTSS